MKKTITTIAILLGITLGATAQNGGGLFQRGFVSEEAYNAGNTRTEGSLLLPNGHGGQTDVAAPLGSGIAVLLGFGAAYAFAKRHKE